MYFNETYRPSSSSLEFYYNQFCNKDVKWWVDEIYKISGKGFDMKKELSIVSNTKSPNKFIIFNHNNCTYDTFKEFSTEKQCREWVSRNMKDGAEFVILEVKGICRPKPIEVEYEEV